MINSVDSPNVGSARSLYRLAVILGAGAVVALVAATGLALTSVDLRTPTWDQLVVACRDAILAGWHWPAMAVVLLGSLSLVSLTIGVRSVVRQQRKVTAHLRRLRIVEPIEMARTPVVLFDDERPQAFCAGTVRPRIYLSTGTLIALADAELQAVVAHERHHQSRRDPLRLLLAHAVGEAMFFLPVLRRLGHRYAALAELAADEAAVSAVGSRSTLASALLTFGERSQSQAVVGIAPERVDHLLGQRPRWQIPISLVFGTLVTLTALLATGAAVASISRGAEMSLALVLMQLCSAALAALVATLAGALLLACTRRLRAGGTQVTA